VPTTSAILTLVDPSGTPLGTLPPLPPVGSPWWKDIGEVVDATGLDVTILRLLAADRPGPPGGTVTYLAEYDGPPLPGLRPALTWTAAHPLRMPWAQPGGPTESLAWATRELAALGRTVTGHRQIRTWNLSAVHRIETDQGPVWLKEVPPFMAHESAVLRWLDRPTTPVLLAAAAHRMLLADIPGTDRYDASMTERRQMLADLLAIQTDALGRLPELHGVPTETGDDFRARAEAALPRWLELVSPDDRPVLAELVSGLSTRFAAVADCGVPDTLVHGDFHPGNVRSTDGTRPVIIDWGDARIGHPAIDLLRIRDTDRGDGPEQLTEQWCAHWRRTAPGSDPERAIELIEPVGGLRDALIYGMFLRSIEPTEHPYHLADVPIGLRNAIHHHRTSQTA
jgi:hypothetical protein